MLLPLSLAACGPGLMDPAGPVGAAEKQILLDSLAIMLAIVVPTITATLAFAWWFRAGNVRAQRLPNWAYSGRIELVTWAVPLLTITLLGGVAWISSHALDPGTPLASDKPTLNVQVVSLDWKWLFIYPDEHVASVNEVVVPAGAPVRFSITSGSVMNAFFVPQLGSQIYSMNGMSTTLHLQADHPGTYDGRSYHFSGDGFSDMAFSVRAVSAEEFSTWIDHARQDGPTLDRAGYAQLAKQSSKLKPFTYRQAEPGLYDAIVTQDVPPGPGPTQGRGGPSVTPTSEH